MVVYLSPGWPEFGEKPALLSRSCMLHKATLDSSQEPGNVIITCCVCLLWPGTCHFEILRIWMSFRMVFEFWYLGHAEKRSLAKSRVAMGEALRTGPHEFRLLKVHGT